ncbi:zinc finger protein [Macleaya cordata]|uniref:Zinc finger protein n=1 Tax=Macleaya cordata TaxID=56857 RepID=A0A200QAA9_MACCD|nr:zinc finger protein [Macleaya cordata]
MDLTFISDRQHEILVGVQNVFPNAHHGYCFWHLRNNLKKMIPVKSKLRPYLVWLLKTCAYATTEKKFEDAYARLWSKGGKKVRKFLDAIPLECWANLYFKGQRYGEMTSTLAESFNGWIKFERTLPITPMVHSDPSHRVDLMNWFCSCTKWQLRGIPCPHAVCAIQRSGTPIFQFVTSYYSTLNYFNAYLHPIEPIHNYDKPNIDPKALTILPPIVKPGTGRPRKKRIESAGNNDKKAQKRIEVAGINDKKAKKGVEGDEIIDKKAWRCG